MRSRDDYWTKMSVEMEEKRARAQTLLHNSPKLQKILALFYDHKSPISLGDLLSVREFKEVHRLSEEQLTYRLVDLMQAGLITKISETQDIFAVPLWASSFIAARIKAIRAGEL